MRKHHELKAWQEASSSLSSLGSLSSLSNLESGVHMVRKVERFEDLEVWQGAREIVRSAYDITRKGEGRRDYGLCDQMRRAAVSMMANIAEGFSRRSRREFTQYLFMAKSSGAELQSHLYVALDQGYITHEEFQGLYGQVDGWARQVSSLITYLLNQQRSPTQRTQRTQ